MSKQLFVDRRIDEIDAALTRKWTLFGFFTVLHKLDLICDTTLMGLY